MYWEQLKYLTEISKSQSIHAASNNLYLTPQALSMSIKALEEELGVVLLSRSSAGTVLTTEGEIVYNLSQDILKNIDLIMNVAKDKEEQIDNSVTGELTIYSTTGASNIVLSQIVKRFIQKYPHVSLQIIEENEIANTWAKIDSEKNAIVLYNASAAYIENLMSNFPEDRFLHRVLLNTSLTAAIGMTNELSQKKSLSAKQLQNMKIALIGKDDIERLGLTELFAEDEQLYKRCAVYSNLAMYMEALTSGLYVGFLDSRYYSRWANENKAQIVNIPLKKKIKMYFGYTCKVEALNVPCIREFLKMVNYKYK